MNDVTYPLPFSSFKNYTMTNSSVTEKLYLLYFKTFMLGFFSNHRFNFLKTEHKKAQEKKLNR